MGLTGHSMSHAKWGIGVVEREENNILYVRFHNTTEGEVLKTFMYPDAIVKGYLIAANDDAQSAIKKTENEQKCARCGKTNVRTIDVDGEKMCSSCSSKFVAVCSVCGKVHLSNKVHHAYEASGSFKRKPVCADCVDSHSFICEQCGGRFFSKDRAKESFIERNLCLSCSENVISKCDICGTKFDLHSGASVYENGRALHLCDSCAEGKTFRCSECGYREPLSSLVDSRYIPGSQKVCKGCAHTCDACGEYIFINHDMYAFNEYFCPNCWETKIIECSICGEKFHPKNESDIFCPDCVEMQAYTERLKDLSYLQNSYREEKYYMLDYLDRCELFTQLYKNCKMNLGTLSEKDTTDPFYYLVLDFASHKTIVTYVPSEVKGSVRFSENVTMTEFRSKKGAREVRLAIERWLPSSTNYMETSAGRMQILDYPVLLRVQTDFDKNYGKQWNGPYDYIEIGNYGDTTDFQIIGILQNENK